MNKHPSCKVTWDKTTRASLALSEAVAALMMGNVHLERLLLAEFDGTAMGEDGQKMIENIDAFRGHMQTAKGHIESSIVLGKKNGNPYEGDFRAFNPELHATMWRNHFLAPDCSEQVVALGNELKSDYLATARRFVDTIDELIELAGPVVSSFDMAEVHAAHGTLKWALENGEISLQRDFAALLSHLMVFMKEYLVDSLIATEVVFQTRGTSVLAS